MPTEEPHYATCLGDKVALLTPPERQCLLRGLHLVFPHTASTWDDESLQDLFHGNARAALRRVVEQTDDLAERQMARAMARKLGVNLAYTWQQGTP